MNYKSSFTVIFSKDTGKIIREIWEPYQRLFWPLPWVKLKGKPKFSSWENLNDWFEKKFPGKNIKYSCYGKEKCQD